MEEFWSSLSNIIANDENNKSLEEKENRPPLPENCKAAQVIPNSLWINLSVFLYLPKEKSVAMMPKYYLHVAKRLKPSNWSQYTLSLVSNSSEYACTCISYDILYDSSHSDHKNDNKMFSSTTSF